MCVMGREGLYLKNTNCHHRLLLPSPTSHLAVTLGHSCHLSYSLFRGQLYLEKGNTES